MDRRETYIFTHYSDIADVNTRAVRNLQAEAARDIFREMRKAMRYAVRRVSSSSKHFAKQSRV